jgi:anti-sigma-K factor RskA
MPDHAGPHPDVAAWAMGLLEPVAAGDFERHARTCEWCRRDIDDLSGLPALLERMAPPCDVPAGLEERVFAALEDGRREPSPRLRLVARRRRFRPRLAFAGAAVAIAVAVAIVVVGGGAPVTRKLALRSTQGERVDVTAAVRVTPVGREVRLDIRRLRDPRPDGLYELWFVAPDDTRRNPDRVSAGTFHPDASGRGTVVLLAAADPKRYPRLSVTLEPSDGNPRRTGPEVLRP